MTEHPTSETSKHVSLDGALMFVVQRKPGDITLGFEGTSWHTHGDLLAGEYGVPQEEAVARFMDELLQSQAIIAVASLQGVL